MWMEKFISEFQRRLELKTENWISLVSALIAFVSMVIAWIKVNEAHKANLIAKQLGLRSDRLSVFKCLRDFLNFCSTYTTIKSIGISQAKGTGDLPQKADLFRWEIEQYGPLDMPQVEKLTSLAYQNAVQLQRLIDRLDGPNPKPINAEFETAQENIHALIDGFGSQQKELRNIFDPYLRI